MNETIKKQLNHRTIRSFKDQPLKKEELELLIDVARNGPTSNFQQQYSIISITDPAIKQALTNIGGQDYIANNGHLFLFVVDQNRNHQICKAQGVETNYSGYTEKFIQGFSDAMIAAQNIVVAASSMGIGSVYLGSILNDVDQIVELLNLPQYVYPVVGLALGYPNQEPQIKPKLPRNVIHMENTYQVLSDPLTTLKDYDNKVNQYYDLRNSNQRTDFFTKQILDKIGNTKPKRITNIASIKKQGFMVEDK